VRKRCGPQAPIRGIVLLTLIVGGLVLVPFAGTAGADTTPVTYTATESIPVPPPSSFTAPGGGDGWAVAMTPQAVYNVFHHQTELQVACHLQADASNCWDADPKQITDPTGVGFSTSGQPSLSLDQNTGHLYVYATRNSDATGGVVCIDTANANSSNDPFCGFTALTGPGEAVGGDTNSGITDAVQVGSRWFAFDEVGGSVVGPGAQNKLLCFDLSTGAACAGEPFTIDFALGAEGTVQGGNFPAYAIAAIGSHVIVPASISGRTTLGCFDGSTLAACSGSWPVTGNVPYTPSSFGAPFPLLTGSGAIQGFCLPSESDPCYDLSGNSVATPSGMTDAVGATSGWNGPAVVLGPRVYVPNGDTTSVDCYDYNLGASCQSFPHPVSNLELLYTVNVDPQRPSCLWVNSDGGLGELGDGQIQNFDAFTGGMCGQGAIRVLASSFVVNTQLCTPGSWTSLQVVSPDRSAYKDGNVAFVDASNVQIPGADPRPLDDTGTASLTGLDLATQSGLPQFLVTLNGAGNTPTSVTVKVTWTGAFDPSCATLPGTTVVNPPTNTAPAAPPKADVVVSESAPTAAAPGSPVAFTTRVTDKGPDTATGVIVRTPVPAGATLGSVSSSTGSPCVGGTVATCYVGTLTAGQTATITTVLSSATAGALSVTSTVESDYDPDESSNHASATTTLLGSNQIAPPPPPPTAPGTYNALAVGTVLVNGAAVSPDQVIVVKLGDTVDVTNGALTITSVDGSFLTLASSQILPDGTLAPPSSPPLLARFRIDPGQGTLLTLLGGDFSACTSSRKAAAASKKPIQHLWGSGKGSFSMAGRFSVATVRGTIWLVQDECDGTLTQVEQGIVSVLDETKNTTVSVNAGQSYLALPPAGTFTPPTQTRTQTAATVRAGGLRWAGHVFKTKAAFARYLRGHGSSWAAFAKAHPGLAAALASRG